MALLTSTSGINPLGNFTFLTLSDKLKLKKNSSKRVSPKRSNYSNRAFNSAIVDTAKKMNKKMYVI